MCFQFYEGKGYSEDFTDHMTGSSEIWGIASVQINHQIITLKGAVIPHFLRQIHDHADPHMFFSAFGAVQLMEQRRVELVVKVQQAEADPPVIDEQAKINRLRRLPVSFGIHQRPANGW